MSNGFAIAAVTAVIRRTLLEAFAATNLSDVVGNIGVTAEPPDRIILPGNSDPTQVNIFLRQISTNPAFRNWDLPSRNHNGDPVSGPPLAIDLHYFVTAYGADMFYAEMLLGHAALALHEYATLTREWIARALAPVPPDSSVPAELTSSGIGAQLEIIKLLPEPVDSEEMSRLWSAIQGQYRPTIAYRATVVLMEPRNAGALAPPVRTPGGRGVTLVNLQLDSVTAESPTTDLVLSDSVILLTGGDFVRGEMSIEIGDTLAVPVNTDISTAQMTFDLSSLATPPRAGVQAVRVIRTRQYELAPATPTTDISNTVALSIHSSISASVVNISETDSVDGTPIASGDITLTINPPVGRRQTASVLLNAAGTSASYRLIAPPDNGAGTGVETVTEIVFPFRRLVRGDYLLRVSVDGAESLLTVDGDGVHNGPEVTL